MPIKDWPVSERPRERLLAQGAAALSDAELLALLLGSGSAGCSALDSARGALQQLGGVRALLTAPPERIAELAGWGPARFARLQAVLELGKRMLREDAQRAAPMESPQKARNYLCMALAQPAHEVFAVLFLDAQHRLLACEEMFRGTLFCRGTGRFVHIERLFRGHFS